MAFLLVGFVILFILTSLPSLWTRYILNKYRVPHPEIPGTGGQFAEHLKTKLKLTAVSIEETQDGDHYDPLQKVVRISNENWHSNSITAIATVAHEFGHALQDHQDYAPLQQRTLLIQRAMWMQKFSGWALMVTPILIPLLHTPLIGVVTFGAGFMAMGVPVMIHLSTLPVEFDASFKRALPLLEAGEYLAPKDHRIAKKILLACALTYVAAALSSLFNLWKWFRSIRR